MCLFCMFHCIESEERSNKYSHHFIYKLRISKHCQYKTKNGLKIIFKNRGLVKIVLMCHWSRTKDVDKSRNIFQPQLWDELNTKDPGRHKTAGAFWGQAHPAQLWKPHTDRHTASNHQITSPKAMSARLEEPSVCHVESTGLSINFTYLCMCMHLSASTFDLEIECGERTSAAAVQNKHQFEGMFHLRLTFEARFNEVQPVIFLYCSAWVRIGAARCIAKLTPFTRRITT